MDSATIKKDISKLRRKLVRNIISTITPHLWDSGYRRGMIGASRPLKIWSPEDKNGKISNKSYKISGYTISEVFGFTEDGAITDFLGGGLVTDYYSDLPIEDLMALDKLATKIFTDMPVVAEGRV